MFLFIYIFCCVFQRKCKATELYNTHVSPSASEPVNVDSHAQKTSQQGLDQGKPNLFDVAQKQVTTVPQVLDQDKLIMCGFNK